MPMSPKVYVIIPHYNNYHLLHSRLWELYKYCRNSIDEIVVMDNGSTEEATIAGLRWWAEFRVKQNFNVSALQTTENLGFLRACNLALSDTVSKCDPKDIIILLSNDVEIRTDFIHQMTEVFSHGGKVIIGGILLSQDTGWNRFGDKIFPYLEGWLLGTIAESWTELGNFDERYVPCDFEDVDLSTTALSLGYELVPMNNPGIHHIGAQTLGYTPARRARTDINKKKFEEKWVK